MAEKEYIERGALIENMKRVYCTDCNSYSGVRCRACGTGDALDMIEDAPTANVVEVVRCCDCKHCETVIHSIVDEPKWFCTRMVRAFDVDPTSFCSYGERKNKHE